MNYLSPFEYNNIVTGQRFVGREKEVSRLRKLISAHKNALLYGPPKIGKRSIVHNALKGMDLEKEGIAVCKFDLFNIRHIDKFLRRLARSVARTLFSENEQQKAYASLLKNVTLDPSSREPLTDRQIKVLLKFPQVCRTSAERLSGCRSCRCLQSICR